MPDAPKDRVRPDDPVIWPADDWNRDAEDVEKIARIGVAPPLSMVGRTIRDLSPRPASFRLSGSSSPYAGQTVVWQDGAWVDAAFSCSGCLFEVNARAGLSGKVVRAWPGSPGEWLFQYVRRGAAYVIPTQPCSVCPIPRVDLHLTFYYNNVFGVLTSYSTTLVYSAGPPASWTSASVSQTTLNYDQTNVDCDVISHAFQLLCGTGVGPVLSHLITGFGGVGCNPEPFVEMSQDSGHSCSPFSFDVSVSNPTFYAADKRYVVSI